MAQFRYNGETININEVDFLRVKDAMKIVKEKIGITGNMTIHIIKKHTFGEKSVMLPTNTFFPVKPEHVFELRGDDDD